MVETCGGYLEIRKNMKRKYTENSFKNRSRFSLFSLT